MPLLTSMRIIRPRESVTAASFSFGDTTTEVASRRASASPNFGYIGVANSAVCFSLNGCDALSLELLEPQPNQPLSNGSMEESRYYIQLDLYSAIYCTSLSFKHSF